MLLERNIAERFLCITWDRKPGLKPNTKWQCIVCCQISNIFLRLINSGGGAFDLNQSFDLVVVLIS